MPSPLPHLPFFNVSLDRQGRYSHSNFQQPLLGSCPLKPAHSLAATFCNGSCSVPGAPSEMFCLSSPQVSAEIPRQCYTSAPTVYY